MTMNFLAYLRVEAGRLFRRRTTWAFILLSAASPIAGYAFYTPCGSANLTNASKYIANPSLAGTFAGGILFGLFALLEMSRTEKSQTENITGAIASPLSLASARMVAVLLAALASGALAPLLFLPYTLARMGRIFSPSLYFSSYFILMLPAMMLGALACAAFYQITQRLDLSLLLYAALALLTTGQACEKHYLARWLNPVVTVYSDDFGNSRILRIVWYNRILWFSMLLGLWLLSLLCIRRYGKGAAGSFLLGIRRLPLSAGLIALSVFSVVLYRNQPYIDHSPLEVNWDRSFTTSDHIYLRSTYIDAHPNTKNGRQYGVVIYTLLNDSGEEQLSSLELNPGYTLESLSANGVPLSFEDLQDDDLNGKEVRFTLPASPEIQLTASYSGMLKEWSIIESSPGDHGIDDAYITLLNSGLAPLPNMLYENGARPAITVDVTLPGHMTPVITGDTLTLLRENEDGSKTWRSEGTGRTLHVYAGDYICQELTAAGIPIQFYYSAKHRQVMEEANIVQTLSNVFEYCTQHYGPYRFASANVPLKLIQSSAAGGGGGYAGLGMSVMDEGSFNEEGLLDPLKGASSQEVIAHEIIHQWWGLCSMFLDEDEWTSEGLTVYATYRLMKSLYGEQYAQKNYVDLWQTQVDEYNQNFYIRHPEYLRALPKAYQEELYWSGDMVSRYCLMPLKLLKAEKLLGGEEAMDAVLMRLHCEGGTESPPYLTYNDFLNASNLTKEDLELD